MVFKLDNRRPETGKAVPFFVAIHREIKSPGSWKK
jgi:hypothetical protein